MKYLGVDYGMRKTGLAVGDSTAAVAVPFDVIAGGKETIPRILEVVKSEGIEAFVVGLPIPTNASQNEDQLLRVVAFVKALGEASGLLVSVVDEQFSSTEARRIRSEYGGTAGEDAIAAMLILQAFFDEGPAMNTGV